MSYFLVMAICAAICASISSGIVGSYVVAKRIVFISGSIAHSVLGGIGLFLYLKRTYSLEFLSPMYGALLFAILSAFLIGWIQVKHKQREDTVIAALWAFGMSLGVIFISLTPGYNSELMQYLFGNILWTSSIDIIILLALDLLIIVCALLFHKRFQAICFDKEISYLQGIGVTRTYFFLLALVAVTVVLLIQVIGAILVIAMLCLPPAIASGFTKKLSHMIVLATIVAIFLSLLGTFTSYFLNWPPGATIALVSTICYFLVSGKNNKSVFLKKTELIN